MLQFWRWVSNTLEVEAMAFSLLQFLVVLLKDKFGRVDLFLTSFDLGDVLVTGQPFHTLKHFEINSVNRM